MYFFSSFSFKGIFQVSSHDNAIGIWRQDVHSCCGYFHSFCFIYSLECLIMIFMILSSDSKVVIQNWWFYVVLVDGNQRFECFFFRQITWELNCILLVSKILAMRHPRRLVLLGCLASLIVSVFHTSFLFPFVKIHVFLSPTVTWNVSYLLGDDCSVCTCWLGCSKPRKLSDYFSRNASACGSILIDQNHEAKQLF